MKKILLALPIVPVVGWIGCKDKKESKGIGAAIDFVSNEKKDTCFYVIVNGDTVDYKEDTLFFIYKNQVDTAVVGYAESGIGIYGVTDSSFTFDSITHKFKAPKPKQ